MERYDPENAVPGGGWLAMDEARRLLLVEEYHRDARIPLPKRARRAHASLHVVVENQLAMNEKPVVRALARLMDEGLSRHEAVHAIGCVFLEEVNNVLARSDPSHDVYARYLAAVERLTAAQWRDLADD